jgi:iron complex transport system ATP-binding protein
MMSEEKIIAIKNASIGYRQKADINKVVKENISLQALKGELVALIGGNGIGKSTLLRTIAGIQPALKGDINLKGKSIKSFHEKDLALIMSFVSTEIIRVSNLSVYDLISLGRYPHTNWTGRLTDEDRRVVEEAIEIVGLKGYENRMVNYISDGERQKTMIARTLAQDTDIIVLDEPTAFLDLSNKYEIVHILHRLANEKGKTILFSTHDLATAIAESDKVWLMLENSVDEGSPEDLILNGSFSALFHNNNLFFDQEKGDFRIKKEVKSNAVVSGEGIKLNWTIKALERIGYKVINEKDSISLHPVLHIDVSYPFWKLKFRDSEMKFDSLYAMCRFINNEGKALLNIQ